MFNINPEIYTYLQQLIFPPSWHATIAGQGYVEIK